jgi:iron-regulated transporter 1
MSPEQLLILSRLSAAVSWRSWEFVAALILSDLYPNSLTIVAVFGLSDTFVQIVTGSSLGSYVDRTERYRSATVMYIIQHVLICSSALAAAGAFFFDQNSSGRAGLSAVVVIAGVFSGAGATGSALSVEQVWVVALCGKDSDALTNLNSKLRAVDLAALLFAPLAAAAALQFTTSWVFAIAFAIYSGISFFPEAFLLRLADVALLERNANKKMNELEVEAVSDSASNAETTNKIKDDSTVLVSGESNSHGVVKKGLSFIIDPLVLYVYQPSFLLMFALALLYFTVLSFHGVMTVYLKVEGSSDVAISLFRGAGAVFGILSTAVFPCVAGRIALPSLSAISVLFQLAFITLGAIPLSLDLFFLSRDVLLSLFQGFTAVSRFGLWLADLSISQYTQETTDTKVLGSVQGTQRSVCALFELLSYVTTLIFSNPQQFSILMYCSLAAVALSGAICVFVALSQQQSLKPHTKSIIEVPLLQE